MDMDNSVEINYGSGEVGWAEEGKGGGNWENCNRITIKMIIK